MVKVWPMGCKKVKDENHLTKLMNSPDYVAQVKLDGVRCVMHIGPDGYLRFTTRGQSVDQVGVPIDITHRLTHLQEDYRAIGDTILDGELYCPYMTSSEVSGQVTHRSTVGVDKRIRFFVFDILKLAGSPLSHMSFDQRMAILHSVDDALNQHKHTVVTYYSEPEDKLNLLRTELENGREGVVFKNRNAPYKLGESKGAKPANHWYKYKKKDTVDVVITGAELPEQFYRDPDTRKVDESRLTLPWSQGWLGSITFVDEDGYTGSCSGLTHYMRATLSDGHHGIKPEYVGRIMEVEFMERTADNNLRHPRFVRLREEVEK